MNQYLNRAEKNQVLTISAFVGYLIEKSNEWEKAGKNKDAIRYLRTAKSFALKGVDYLFDGLNQDELSKIINDVSKMDIAIKYKDEALRDYQKMLELDSVTPVETNDLMDICAQAIEFCKVCGQVPSECRLRKLLIKYDVPVLNYGPELGGCPYRD